MGQIQGSVRVTGLLAPTDTSDTYAVTDEHYNRGGYRSVLTVSERDAITPDRRKEGMVVCITSSFLYYTLIGGILNQHWVLWTPGITASLRKYTKLIGNGVDTAITITHGLSSFDVLAQVQRVSTNEVVLVDLTFPTADSVVIRFANPPATNSFRVVIFG